MVRAMCPQGRGGSSPLTRTTDNLRKHKETRSLAGSLVCWNPRRKPRDLAQSLGTACTSVMGEAMAAATSAASRDWLRSRCEYVVSVLSGAT
jgi:hypothetical protein